MHPLKSGIIYLASLSTATAKQYFSISLQECLATNQHFDNSTTLCDVAKDVFPIKCTILFLYSLITFVGLVGNFLVVWVVARTKSIQTITNIFIANLAVSDILMCTVATPFTPLSLYMKTWTLPEIVCKLLPITMGVSVYVSTLTSTAIALDRFFVIVHPFLPRMRVWLCFVIIVTIWIISILISMPLAVYHQKRQDKEKQIWACQENWPKESSREVFTIVSFILQFVVPCSIITVCYFRISLILRMRLRSKIGSGTKSRSQDVNEIRRKRRTNSILIAMVVIFVICWIPLNMLLISTDVLSESHAKIINNSSYFSLIFLVCHLIAMSSAVYNPFLYAWMNENFKKEVRRMLPGICRGSSNENHRTTFQTFAGEYSALPTNERQLFANNALIPLKVVNAELKREEDEAAKAIPEHPERPLNVESNCVKSKNDAPLEELNLPQPNDGLQREEYSMSNIPSHCFHPAKL
ncbi:unnamed protein product [Dicrocoelium dendriticum]|nr:unnamed protein product [Dicrocoelium dendriticum]